MKHELPRILVGVDFSPSSDRATEEAKRLARQMGAQLDFVHFCQLPAGMKSARKTLDGLEHRSRAEGFVAKTHLGMGSPVFGLLDFIQRLRPGLVVIGSHGRGAQVRFLVAESLIRCSPVAVLVVPSVERVALPAV